jgi:hypothetical protein
VFLERIEVRARNALPRATGKLVRTGELAAFDEPVDERAGAAQLTGSLLSTEVTHDASLARAVGTRRCRSWQRTRDRKAWMGIGLYQREARTPENGPPPAAAGAVAAQAPRVSVHSGRTWRHRRHGPAAAHVRPAKHSKPTPTEPIEPPTYAPDLPAASRSTPTPARPDPRLPPRRLDGSPTPLTTTPTHASQLARPLPPPRPRPTRTRLGCPPRFTWRVEEGGPAQRGGPPSSKAQAGSEKRPWAGRRPVRP